MLKDVKKEKAMEFKEKLIYIRAKLNLSQTDLAKILNVSYVTICRWECGKVTPTKKAEYAVEQLCKDNGIHFNEVSKNEKI